MQGRRLPDTVVGNLPLPLDDLLPGDIWRVLRLPGVPAVAADWPGADPAMAATNLTGGVWMFWSPNGAGLGTLVYHTVREHDDDTVSVRPGDGSSNSILQKSGYAGKEWHGYVEHNVWSAC